MWLTNKLIVQNWEKKKNKPKNFVEISIDKIMKNEQITQIIEDATVDELLSKIEGL